MTPIPIPLRIRAARKHAGLNQTQLGEACGWTKSPQSRIANYESLKPDNKNTPSNADLILIADACQVSRSFMTTGEGEMVPSGTVEHRGPIRVWHGADDADGLVVLPRYEVWAAMGEGNHVHEEPDQNRGDAYRADFVQQQGWSPATHFTMRVRGVSMIEAGLMDGWSIVVDSTDKAPQDGEIYVIRHPTDGLIAKFLEVLPDRGLRIVSANSQHPVYKNPIVLTAEQADAVEILGRVVHVQGLLGKRRT